MGRSGTTLLLRLLDSHPEIFLVPIDSMLLTHFLPSFRATGDAETFEEAFIARYSEMMRKPLQREEGIAYLRQVLREHLSVEKALARTLFRDLLQALAYQYPVEGRCIWLEKTPKNEFYLREIFENFPKARIIFNVRDPRAVLASFKKGNIPNTTPEEVATSWSTRINTLLKFLTERPDLKERVFLVRYEDYVSSGDATLSRMLNFIGLDTQFRAEPTFFGKPFAGNSFDPSSNMRGELDSSKIDSWRKELTQDEAATVARFARFEMSLLGYGE